MQTEQGKGCSMAVNWFEGGRRIRDLLLWAVALCGGIYVIWGSTPTVYFSTRHPDDSWKFTGEDCTYPNESKYLWSYAFKPGDKRSVSLCFLVNEREKIPYREAPRPENEPPPKINIVPVGSPPIPPPKWYWEGEAYQSDVQDYMRKRTAEFRMTPELEKAARGGLGKLAWNAGMQRFNDAYPFVFGIAAVFWILTGLTGWIVRGFAGIPAGADFRPAKRE